MSNCRVFRIISRPAVRTILSSLIVPPLSLSLSISLSLASSHPARNFNLSISRNHLRLMNDESRWTGITQCFPISPASASKPPSGCNFRPSEHSFTSASDASLWCNTYFSSLPASYDTIPFFVLASLWPDDSWSIENWQGERQEPSIKICFSHPNWFSV